MRRAVLAVAQYPLVELRAYLGDDRVQIALPDAGMFMIASSTTTARREVDPRSTSPLPGRFRMP